MSLVPSYTAASVRACALRGVLLAADEWPRLAGIAGTGAAIEWLKARGVVDSGVAGLLSVERSAHASVIRNGTGLLRFVRGPLSDLLRCFVYYYDLLNVESVAYRIHTFSVEEGHAAGRLYDTGPFGLFSAGALDAVTNYAALGRALRHSVFANAFDAGLVRYQEDEDVVRLVERVEVAFFANWVGAAERCGVFVRGVAGRTALGIFFAARAIGAAVRLKLYRQAQTNRIVEWLSLVARQSEVERCLALLSGTAEAELVREMAGILVPSASTDDGVEPWMSGPRGIWGFLDGLVMRAALKRTRGIAFGPGFLTAILVRQMCQARQLTVLLESKHVDLAVPLSAAGGGMS